ncbi:MAG: hypothetical protein NVSMB2_08660 [Chloroflexota bacterium]
MSDDRRDPLTEREHSESDSEGAKRLGGFARTPDRQSVAVVNQHAPAAGKPPRVGQQSGFASGGTRPRGRIEPYSAAEIVQRATSSAPGVTTLERQYGARRVSVAPDATEPSATAEHPRRGSRGNPGGTD